MTVGYGVNEHLFSSGGLREVLLGKTQAAIQAIRGWNADDLLMTPDQDVVDRLLDQYALECPILDREGIQALPSTERDHVGRDGWGDRFNQRMVTRSFVIPFRGDAEVFKWQASTFLSGGPAASVLSANDDGGELQVSIETPVGAITDATQIRHHLDRTLDTIERCLQWSAADIKQHNEQLGSLPAQVAARKKQILGEREIDAAIGFPIRQRADARQYAAPLRRRRLSSQRLGSGEARGKPFKPEPVMIDEDYEAALRVVRSSRNALERSPSMVATLTEERIRDLLLVNLNAVFEGAAAGEVFNNIGKTDILVRVDDRNIFIAECKIWNGPKTIDAALTQLLGYLTWRDTKAALLLFIRNGEPTAIIGKSITALREHTNFKRMAPQPPDGDRTDFTFHANGDPEREIRVAFMPFVLPR